MSEAYEAASEVADAIRGLREEVYLSRLDREDLSHRRERIATAAMQGILASPDERCIQADFSKVVEWSVEVADLLLAALNKGPKDAAPAETKYSPAPR